jgi:hypothetical protein
MHRYKYGLSGTGSALPVLTGSDGSKKLLVVRSRDFTTGFPDLQYLQLSLTQSLLRLGQMTAGGRLGMACGILGLSPTPPCNHVHIEQNPTHFLRHLAGQPAR